MPSVNMIRGNLRFTMGDIVEDIFQFTIMFSLFFINSADDHWVVSGLATVWRDEVYT